MDPSPSNKGDGTRLAIMWILTVAFLLALPLMFVHPGMVLSLFWLGLIVVGASMVIGWVSNRARRMGARHALHHHRCPHCHESIQGETDDAGSWHCPHCGAVYLASGARIPVSPSAS